MFVLPRRRHGLKTRVTLWRRRTTGVPPVLQVHTGKMPVLLPRRLGLLLQAQLFQAGQDLFRLTGFLRSRLRLGGLLVVAGLGGRRSVDAELAAVGEALHDLIAVLR